MNQSAQRKLRAIVREIGILVIVLKCREFTRQGLRIYATFFKYKYLKKKIVLGEKDERYMDSDSCFYMEGIKIGNAKKQLSFTSKKD